MSTITDERMKLFEGVKPEILDRVASLKRGVRERAIAVLVRPLNQQSEKDLTVFQTIPVEFLDRGDFLGAIWFVETVCKRGWVIDISVVQGVYACAVAEIHSCVLEGDKKEAQMLSSSLETLFDTMESSSLYKEVPEFYALIGTYEEGKNELIQALEYYHTAIEYDDVNGHLGAARIHEKLGQFEKSLQTLDDGWLLHADTRCLAESIRILCKQGDMTLAATKYTELHYIQKGHVGSFLLYKGTIESDDEVSELEDIVVQYVKEGTFVPLEELAILSAACDVYIMREIKKETAHLVEFQKKSKADRTKEDVEKQIESIERQLWLLQIGTLTLGNEKYMPDYLRALRRLGFEGAPHRKEILQDFFANYPSAEADRSRTNTTLTNVFEAIAMHVTRTAELFYQPGFYGIQEELIIPLLRDCEKMYSAHSDEGETGYTLSLANLRNFEDYYMSLRPTIRTIHREMLLEFDEKYGIYYRTHLQSLALKLEDAGEKHFATLRQHPEAAFIFWVEAILMGHLTRYDTAQFNGLVQEYGLCRLGKEKSLLLATLFYDICPEYALDFLSEIPHMLDVPEALYIVTRGLRHMKDKDRNDWIKYLHGRIKTDYVSRGFFEHIRHVFDGISKNNPSDADTECMLLTNGNIAILKRKEANKSAMDMRAIINFKTAGDYNSIQGLTETSVVYESNGDHDAALAFLEQAFLQDMTFSNLTKILDCTFHAGNYDTMQEYIDQALRMGWGVGNYVVALNLGRGMTDTGFRQILSMVHAGEPLRDTPPGLLKITESIVYSVLRTGKHTEYEDIDTLRVLASFIDTKISHEETPPAIEDSLLVHWDHISHLCDSYTGDELHEKIQSSLVPITGTVEIPLASPSDISAELLNTHAKGTYVTLYDILKTKHTAGNSAGVVYVSHIMDEFCTRTNILLQRFPGTEKQIMPWIEAIAFETPTIPSSAMPPLIQ